MSVLDAPHFHDEKAAIARLEALLWPGGPICPHCGSFGKIYEIRGKTARPGLRTCGDCRKQFTVKIGTLFEDSHIPLYKWWQAVHLLCSSKKGISSHQLHRTLKVTYKTAWFMAHRIREAMRSGSLAPMGGSGGVVEIDETIYGRAATHPKGRARDLAKRKITNSAHKNIILSLVERGGSVRSYHIDSSTVATVIPIVTENVSKEAQVMTDSAQMYRRRLGDFASHDRVDHSEKEYARYEEGRPVISTNAVESYFAIFKRGMRGTYQHCKEKHLHRYLAEFDFRHNNRSALGVQDEDRTLRALAGIAGKRLTYRDSSSQEPRS